MKDLAKWIYTYFLLAITIGWAVFLVWVVKGTLANPTEINILEMAGVSVLLGALIAWNGSVNQFWFRKKGPTNGGDSTPPTT